MNLSNSSSSKKKSLTFVVAFFFLGIFIFSTGFDFKWPCVIANSNILFNRLFKVVALEIKKATEISRTHEWRVLLYGKPGLGKTSAIKGLMGKVLVLDLDGSSRVLAGLKDVDVISFNRENPIQSMKEFLDEARGILKEYQTLVIDNITAFEKDWFVARGLKSKNGIRNEIQDYGDYTNYFLRLITMIYSLPINIYVTAWEDKRDIDLEDGTKLTEYIPQVRNQVMKIYGLQEEKHNVA